MQSCSPQIVSRVDREGQHVGHVTSKLKGSWCSGITSAPHAEGPGFKSQWVHYFLVRMLLKARYALGSGLDVEICR